jgi:hypothetical protein
MHGHVRLGMRQARFGASGDDHAEVGGGGGGANRASGNPRDEHGGRGANRETISETSEPDLCDGFRICRWPARLGASVGPQPGGAHRTNVTRARKPLNIAPSALDSGARACRT